MVKYDQLIFEISKEGRRGYKIPGCKVDDVEINDVIPADLLRKKELGLPEVSEPQLVRHYTLLSNKNFGVDTGFYPLGSCTMKYNPKINEDMAALDGFVNLHPYQDETQAQGALELMYDLSSMLSEVGGMDAFTLQPAAGAHGELTGLMIIKAYHEKRGETRRNKIIVPDSAHGTNPASANVAGFEVVEIKSTKSGAVDLDNLKAVLGDDIAGLMLTNPSTLGLFEQNILEIAELVHEAGGLLYYDGANLNAILGQARPGDMGFDVVHYNLHKTFSTPHGGGGPGSGPVGVKAFLEPFLPAPIVSKVDDRFILDYDRPDTIGRMKGFNGNFGILVRAYTYILSMGGEGLKRASEMAVLNANYMQAKLKEYYNLPVDTICKHEFVLAGLKGELNQCSTLDVAKRLLDHGYHPPTIYFPLIVHDAIMIEPTETESLETLDAFIDVMIQISKEADETPELLKQAPTTTQIRRVDEVLAARSPVLKWEKQV
ncbi:aminomethyl-transferring glycine dehydrogenase subunit GcvPB [Fusibacter ferrireducens]|uniref:Probable glycine dehydrogenase (decarboxylating) subunit 2 n=1 Tax=Fusibacter ferrireducens TaxID=2785058 RepID=A0ABR9ZUP2_9FIRM|nr:aminomethyl-transferring glycine dehydrogenase subunit GcvPB [Fusibacter ferrireducens]MBF4693873.1 aminomethyl-transferring glycine dehydrogenase subunit GcvPB [Fusibacter ferrireducens]